MRRIAGIVGLATLAAAPLLVSGAAAGTQAAPICESVTVDQTRVGPVTVGPVCVPYNNATLCSDETISVGSNFAVTWHLCGPAPVLTGESQRSAGDA